MSAVVIADRLGSVDTLHIFRAEIINRTRLPLQDRAVFIERHFGVSTNAHAATPVKSHSSNVVSATQVGGHSLGVPWLRQGRTGRSRARASPRQESGLAKRAQVGGDCELSRFTVSWPNRPDVHGPPSPVGFGISGSGLGGSLRQRGGIGKASACQQPVGLNATRDRPIEEEAPNHRAAHLPAPGHSAHEQFPPDRPRHWVPASAISG